MNPDKYGVPMSELDYFLEKWVPDYAQSTIKKEVKGLLLEIIAEERKSWNYNTGAARALKAVAKKVEEL